jgi:hypothetical protein
MSHPFWRALRRQPERTVFVALWIALTVLALVPVWHQRMLPMLDTPDHLALARAWHNYHDGDWHIADYYTLRIRIVPYLFFYWTIHMLLHLFSIETANKIFLSVYLIVYPLSILRLARSLGRSRWLALGAFALAFNPCWIYGFSSYLLGTCFLYFGWAQLIDYLHSDDDHSKVYALGIFCLLAYLSHVLAWGLFGLGAIALFWHHRRQWVRVAYASAALSPTLLLCAWAWRQEQREHAYMNRGHGIHGIWKDFPDSVKEFPRRIMEIFPGDFDYWVLGGLAATVLVYLVWRRRDATPLARARTGCLRVILFMLAVAYLMLPFTLDRPMSWWYVAARVPAIMAPLILLLPDGTIEGARALAALPMLVLCVLLPLRLTTLYSDFDRRHLGFMQLVDEVPRGARVLVLPRGLLGGGVEDSGDPSSSAPVFWHFLSWPMALKGGFSPSLFNQGIPVQPRPGLPTFNIARTDRFEFRAYPEYDYYIIHESSDILRADQSVRIEERRAGGWILYKRVAHMTDEP